MKQKTKKKNHGNKWHEPIYTYNSITAEAQKEGSIKYITYYFVDIMS